MIPRKPNIVFFENVRSITVGPDQAAVIISDGAYGEPQIETRVETRGRLGRNIGGAKEITVLRIDLTPFSIVFETNETSGSQRIPDALIFTTPILTSDRKLVTGTVRITLAVVTDYPEHLVQVRSGKNVISATDIGIAIRDEFQSKVIQPAISEIQSPDLHSSSKQVKELGASARAQLEPRLTGYGLKLMDFAPSFLPVEILTDAERQQFERRKSAVVQENEIQTKSVGHATLRFIPRVNLRHIRRIAGNLNPWEWVKIGIVRVKKTIDGYTRRPDGITLGFGSIARLALIATIRCVRSLVSSGRRDS
jgi:hypothetical protein